MKWIPMSERKPLLYDADECGEVLFRFERKDIGKHETVSSQWDEPYWNQTATHFARIRDIELPPPPPAPAPVMPEKLEFVKARPGEIGDRGELTMDPNGALFILPQLCPIFPPNTLYRRVP